MADDFSITNEKHQATHLRRPKNSKQNKSK